MDTTAVNIPTNGADMTIIVPVFNRSGLVLRTLDSIKAQTYRPIRLIVVDNNSTDRTPEVLVRWKKHNEAPDFQVDILTEPERGAARARQRGFDYSRSEYVMFFDSDDTMEPGHVKRIMETFAAHRDADLISWRVRLHGLKGRMQVTHGSGHHPVFSHLVHSLLRTQGYAVRRDYFQRHGGWNTELTGWDDWELGVRLLLGSPKMVSLKEIPVDVYCREDSITGADFSSRQGEWERALDKAEEAVLKSSVDSKEGLVRWIAYRRIILAAQYNKEGNIIAVTELLKRVRKDSNLSGWRKWFLRMAFTYTSRGGRGIGLPARWVL